MAIFLLISDKQESKNNVIGDIVGVFEDDHPFSDYERERFDFVKVRGTREEIDKLLKTPPITEAYMVDGKWQLEPPLKLDERGRMVIDKKAIQLSEPVWQGDDGDWRFLKTRLKYHYNYNKLSVIDRGRIKNGDKSQIVKMRKSLIKHDFRNGQKVEGLNG